MRIYNYKQRLEQARGSMNLGKLQLCKKILDTVGNSTYSPNVHELKLFTNKRADAKLKELGTNTVYDVNEEE